MQQNGFIARNDQVLEPFENIQNLDALLDRCDPANHEESHWPPAVLTMENRFSWMELAPTPRLVC